MGEKTKTLLGNLKNILGFGSSNAYKTVVTDANGDLTVEDKLTGSSTNTDIKMNGTQSAGSSPKYAKADHVHPTDTSRAASDHGHTNYNKATYNQTLASTTTGAYEIGAITVDGNTTTIYGKDTNTVYSHPTSKQCSYSYSHPSTQQCTHNHDGTYLKSYTPPTASTSQAGIVQLNTATNSTSTAQAATPSAVKAAYDKGNHSHPYASSSHSHGSLASGGTLNSDISSVNKVAVTDSSNNLKTISQLPYSKISGTPTIPSKTSQLTNDSGFLTSHQSLSNYVTTNDSRLSDARTPTSHTHDDRYYTESEIDTKLNGKVNTATGMGLSSNDFTSTYKTALDNLNTTIANAVGNLELVEVVTNLPTSNIKTNKLYLKANSVNGSENKYDVYIRVNNAWEKVDSLDFNISDYLKTSDASSTYLSKTDASSTYVAKETGKGLFSGSYNDLTNKPTIPAAVTVDSSLSSSSTNPVQNKVINSALAGKSDSGHNHDGTYLKSYTPPTASTSAAGIVQLNDSIDGYSTTQAATSRAVGSVYATASAAMHTADNLSNIVDGKEDTSNKVSAWSSTTTNNHYPSEKLVKDSLDGKSNTGHTHTKSEISDFPSTMTPSSHTHTKSEITDFPTTMTPTSHTHGNITNDGKIGSLSGRPVITTTGGAVTTGSFGSSAGTFCQGNDDRLHSHTFSYSGGKLTIS